MDIISPVLEMLVGSLRRDMRLAQDVTGRASELGLEHRAEWPKPPCPAGRLRPAGSWVFSFEPKTCSVFQSPSLILQLIGPLTWPCVPGVCGGVGRALSVSWGCVGAPGASGNKEGWARTLPEFLPGSVALRVSVSRFAGEGDGISSQGGCVL